MEIRRKSIRSLPKINFITQAGDESQGCVKADLPKPQHKLLCLSADSGPGLRHEEKVKQ